MAYQDNKSAIGTYRTAAQAGTYLGQPYPKGWAAYDKAGTTWPVSEEDATAINAKREKRNA